MDIPEKFPEVIRDFLADLSTTFPEYVYLWESLNPDDGSNINPLYQYCLTTYPERFFDILYQNEEIFLPDSTTNTVFLPHVEFKMLFNAPGISDNTRQAIWKYLQLVLVTIMGNIKSPASFGDTAGLFEGIGEDELQNKLAETIKGLTDFFKGVSKDGMPDMEKAFEEMFDGFSQEGTAEGTADGQEENMGEGEIPSADDLHNHIKGLFDGKIGKLAKELADELSGDVMNMFDDGSGDATNTADIMKKMMRNPKKIMDLVKKIGSKLDDKMKDGSISQEEIMKEVSEMMTKMKGSGNGKEFESMMKGMMKNMGMGGANLNMSKMNAMMSQQSHKDKMRAKLAQRQQQAQEKAEQEALQRANVILESTAPNEFVFKLKDEDGVQEKSKAPIPTVPVNDDWLDEEPEPTHKSSKKASTGKKGKKGKK